MRLQCGAVHEIVVRVVVEVRQIPLTQCGVRVHCVRPCGRDAAMNNEGTTALRLVAESDRADSRSIDIAIAAWLDDRAGNGCTKSTIAAFKRQTIKFAADAGWRTVADISYEGVSAVLAAGTARGWTPATYNACQSTLKSFFRYLVLAGLLPKNPMDGAEPRSGHASEGARAGTADEARKMILAALIQKARDGRAKSPRALYWLCMFLAACRVEEPGLWTWGDLHLDPDPAAKEMERRHAWMHWRPEKHKNKRNAYLVLAPELAEKLREHRATVPHGPDDPVFPIVPPRHRWGFDRQRAEIPHHDYRNRGYTSHAARKSFKTWLVEAGVQSDVIDHLIRHTRFVGTRYTDPSMDVQAAALEKLPKLWPAQMPSPTGVTRKKCANVKKAVDKRAQIADAVGEAKQCSPTNHKSISRVLPPLGVTLRPQPQPSAGEGRTRDLDLATAESADSAGSQEQGTRSGALMSVSAPEMSASNTGDGDAMKVLLSLANSLNLLLRKGAVDGERSRRTDGTT